MGRINDREYAAAVRDPAKFNSITAAKEYGKKSDTWTDL